VCAAAGVPIAGGHSIDSVEPIYGLVALGLVHPERLMRNSTARAGDWLILTKPLGVGVLSAALRQDRLDESGYATLIASTTQLNVLGMELAGMDGVHALTDITGFGLMGHTLEVCRAAGLGAELTAAPPMLAGVEALVRDGMKTGASSRNWESCRAAVDLPADFPTWRRDILTDPQTSGGLLIAVDPARSAAVLELAKNAGFGTSVVVGRLVEGAARLRVLATPIDAMGGPD
ncbi:MAG TPA: selenide, water dikinase SelD, partial [Caulobacteraceae bacterium]